MKKYALSMISLALVAWISSAAAPNRHELLMKMADSPAPVGSIVPQVAPLASGELALTWQEPLTGGGYAFRMAVLHGARWSEPRTIARGPDLSMFTADLPGVIESSPGSLLAYWEMRDTRTSNHVDTLIQIAGSTDMGRTWSKPVQPHRDNSSGEHSFIAVFADGPNTGLVWLDAQKQHLPAGAHSRAMEGMNHGDGKIGAMGLRYVAVDGNREIKADSFIDPVTCECCPNSAARTSRGPVVVYRGREIPRGIRPDDARPGQSVRDVQISRLENGRWTKPHPVFNDRWVIDACPDNGPAVEARDANVAVAWWTRANDHRKVQIAFSGDAGDTFGSPVRVDQGDGEGQVTLTWLEGRDAVVVGWLEDHKVWARVVTRSGEAGPPVSIALSPGHSRLPRWVWREGGVFAAYTAETEGNRRAVRVARLELKSNVR
jgi:hypothetical protein